MSGCISLSYVLQWLGTLFFIPYVLGVWPERMKIPAYAVIADNKLIGYLLLPKPRNDKSKYLAQAGFTQHNPQTLREALWLLIQGHEAFPERSSDYGTFYQVAGTLIGPNGSGLPVITIWLHRTSDGIFQFVTLKPVRSK